jgi:hypothetical protein
VEGRRLSWTNRRRRSSRHARGEAGCRADLWRRRTFPKTDTRCGERSGNRMRSTWLSQGAEAMFLDGPANGVSFDWRCARERSRKKVIVAGGLDASNVARPSASPSPGASTPVPSSNPRRELRITKSARLRQGRAGSKMIFRNPTPPDTSDPTADDSFPKF